MTGNSSIDTSVTGFWRAWLNFRQSKRPTRAIDQFEAQLEINLFRLATEVNHKTYLHGNYQKVVIAEKKRRDLAVANVRDRVVYRLVYDFLVGVVDSHLDPDVWSCRPGKGLHGALQRTQSLLKSYPALWIWRTDITKFFDHVLHDQLLQAIRHHTTDPQTIWLCEQIINSYEILSKQGIPIGNLTSQIFANIYLNEFDRFVRHDRKPIAYVRYGDDLILFGSNQAACFRYRQVSEQFLNKKLGLSLNPRNDVIIRSHDGLHFLGHKIYADGIVIEPATEQRLVEHINPLNAASYQALFLPQRLRKRMPWILQEDIENILDSVDKML